MFPENDEGSVDGDCDVEGAGGEGVVLVVLVDGALVVELDSSSNPRFRPLKKLGRVRGRVLLDMKLDVGRRIEGLAVVDVVVVVVVEVLVVGDLVTCDL